MIVLFLGSLWNFLFLLVYIVKKQKNKLLLKDKSICLWIPNQIFLTYQLHVCLVLTRAFGGDVWLRPGLCIPGAHRHESRLCHTVWMLKLESYSWLHRAREARSIYLGELAVVRSLALCPVNAQTWLWPLIAKGLSLRGRLELPTLIMTVSINTHPISSHKSTMRATSLKPKAQLRKSVPYYPPVDKYMKNKIIVIRVTVY